MRYVLVAMRPILKIAFGAVFLIGSISNPWYPLSNPQEVGFDLATIVIASISVWLLISGVRSFIKKEAIEEANSAEDVR